MNFCIEFNTGTSGFVSIFLKCFYNCVNDFEIILICDWCKDCLASRSSYTLTEVKWQFERILLREIRWYSIQIWTDGPHFIYVSLFVVRRGLLESHSLAMSFQSFQLFFNGSFKKAVLKLENNI